MNEAILEDDFFKNMNTKDEYNTDNQQMESFWSVLKNQLTTETVQRFGIEKVLNALEGTGGLSDYKDGGNVSTIHNAKNGVFVDSEHERRFNAAYDRKNYEGRGDRKLSAQRKKMFTENEEIYDAYTHKKLNKDGRTHIDHITSAKEIHEMDAARLYMTDDERNDMATADSNMAAIDGRMNQSKGEKSMEEWLKKEKDGQTNAERYDVDEAEAMRLRRRSQLGIKGKVVLAAGREVSMASFSSGVAQAKKQVIGLLMHYGTSIFLEEVQSYAANWKNYSRIAERLDALKAMGGRIKDRLIEKVKDIKNIIKEVFASAKEGFISGIVGTIVTTLINMVATTVKSVGKILQDSVTTLIGAFKMWTKNPNNLDKATLAKETIKMISLGASASVGIIAEEGIKTTLASTALAPVADPIGIVGGILVTGVSSAVLIYVMDNFGKIIKKFKDAWNDMMYGLQRTKREILETYNKALAAVDETYRGILSDIKDYYDKMDNLALLAHDMNLSGEEQVSASIAYARASGVDDSELFHNVDEAKKFFLG
ncbi:hypothetical protein R7892_09355 [Ligilactobacillus murinus]|uniref:hypothetical protein n=1 Tax=Ligilactobacillus murinus TaxID=1622 RepID=UPI00296AE47C|nr:hypothetical protein [Ligilactobacillus murinus]WOY88876.1 hypothetical protein R7892_09355 [Ligilactobacillus murinus]